MTATETFLWNIFPYICLAIFAGGHIWRYRYDKFGWTTRSTQLYESRLLRWGSPLFHFGILFALAGHVVGLGIPKRWTEASGLPEGVYHAMAVGLGLLAGIGTIAGMTILIYRRRTVGPVFSATTKNDKAMYLMLAIVILSGMWNTSLGNIPGMKHEYRDTVSPWFRSIFTLDPQGSLMVDVPIGFQVHAFTAFALFAFWPFTRLVHMFSAPVGYLTRPYIVYRSRDARPNGQGFQEPKRGWEKVGTRK
jgi:nitrate reductase gamma subunit